MRGLETKMVFLAVWLGGTALFAGLGWGHEHHLGQRMMAGPSAQALERIHRQNRRMW